MSSKREVICGREERAEITGRALVVNLDWCFSDDLDLGVVCIDKQGQGILIFHANEGARTKRPFVHLAHQSSGEGRRKSRREHIVITDRTQHKEMLVCVWDHKATSEGQTGAFAQNPDSYELTVMDRKNRRIRLRPMRSYEGNLLILGRIREERVEALDINAKLTRAVSKVEELLALTNEVIGDRR